jgi:hypothetical protein
MLLALDLFYKRPIVADFLLCRFKFVICKRILLSTKEFILCENRITDMNRWSTSTHVNESCCRGIRSVRTYQSFTDTKPNRTHTRVRSVHGMGICLNKLTIFHFLCKSNTRARSVHGMSIWFVSTNWPFSKLLFPAKTNPDRPWPPITQSHHLKPHYTARRIRHSRNTNNDVLCLAGSAITLPLLLCKMIIVTLLCRSCLLPRASCHSASGCCAFTNERDATIWDDDGQ